MGFEVPFIIFTIFWLIFGCAGPLIVPKSPNRGLIQTMIIMTAVCCYLFWLIVALAQLNPLFGPTLENNTIEIMKKEWKNVNT